jgi:hypothetical protein
MTEAKLSELARFGAAARIKELRTEIADLQRILIHHPPSTASAAVLSASSGSSPQPRKRWNMSAAARKKISEAQKARWAKQKATKKKQVENRQRSE